MGSIDAVEVTSACSEGSLLSTLLRKSLRATSRGTQLHHPHDETGQFARDVSSIDARHSTVQKFPEHYVHALLLLTFVRSTSFLAPTRRGFAAIPGLT